MAKVFYERKSSLSEIKSLLESYKAANLQLRMSQKDKKMFEIGLD